MSDQTIAERIERLVRQEHELRTRTPNDAAEALEPDTDRLRAIELELDVCWDLLRRRRAVRDGGVSADQAEARDPNAVERPSQ